MKINNQHQEAEAIYPVAGLYIDPDGNAVEKSEMLLSEHRMDVYINDVLTMKLVCTPKDLPGLVLGRMVSEGIIHSSAEVEYLYICEHGTRARVQLAAEQCEACVKNAEVNESEEGHLRDRISKKKQWEAENDSLRAEVMDTPTCCTDNKTIYSGFATGSKLQHLEPVQVSLELMYAFDEAFHQDMPLHEATWSTHSCFLAYKGEIVYSCEDIGRHNALDKAIGYALMHDYDYHECAVFTTGRLPIDMITKVIRAGIPLVASKKTPTAEAVELAQRYGLTMIGRAKNHKMMQYTMYQK